MSIHKGLWDAVNDELAQELLAWSLTLEDRRVTFEDFQKEASEGTPSLSEA